MYSGKSELTIDDKGRLAVPARYRASLVEQCAGRLVVTVDVEPCLLIYPADTWRQFADRLMALNEFDPGAKRVRRHFLGHAEEVEMDRQGRIQLTPALRAQAHLERQAVLAGQGTKFELWAASAWQEQLEEAPLDGSLLASLGI
ncbi:MAG: division/cell wall cluster transcriptional repressor MraZ [Oceanococcaceae bacterium]